MPSPAIRPYVLSPHIAPLIIKDGAVTYAPGVEHRRRVAICGAGGVRDMPWDDPTVECWALNNFWNSARDSAGRLAASRWWEQHQVTPDVGGPDGGRQIQDANDMRWINTCPVPIYMTEPWPANPNAVVWPIAHFEAKFRTYFACTFAMQIAQALEEGFEELLVCGLELLRGTLREATVESSCVSYWLGYVEGRGMQVTLVPHCVRTYRLASGRYEICEETQASLLNHPYRYGHDYWRERRFVEQYVASLKGRPVAI